MPDGKVRLLSPQHWAKYQSGKWKSTTGEFTNAHKCTLHWGKDGQYQLTISLTKDTNVATFALAPRYKNYDIFCQEAAIVDSEDDANPIITSHKSDDEEREKAVPAATPIKIKKLWSPSNSNSSIPCTFDLD